MTTAAPFRAVPSPEPRVELALDSFAGAAPLSASLGAPLERPVRKATAAPPRPAGSRRDADALVSTGPAIGSGIRLAEPAPRLPQQTTANGSSAPAYGDWTKPSHSGGVAPLPPADTFDADDFHGDFDAELEDDAQLRSVPGTAAIPERPVRGRQQRPVDDLDDLDDDYTGDAPAVRGPATGPVTGPVAGGRAAMRAERQAADAARRKAVKRSGGSTAVVLDPQEDGERRKPRRVLQALVAMTVVALGVLGVYSFVSPTTTTETGSSTAAGPSTTPALAPQTDVLPALPTEPVAVDPAPTVPVRVPIAVLNSTDIAGLAGKAAASFGSSGWEAPTTGAYEGGDVAASTVFFTEGDETQRQAAVQLVDQFPQLQGPAPRFFELPADVAATGLVVVVTGDWQP